MCNFADNSILYLDIYKVDQLVLLQLTVTSCNHASVGVVLVNKNHPSRHICCPKKYILWLDFLIWKIFSSQKVIFCPRKIFPFQNSWNSWIKCFQLLNGVFGKGSFAKRKGASRLQPNLWRFSAQILPYTQLDSEVVAGSKQRLSNTRLILRSHSHNHTLSFMLLRIWRPVTAFFTKRAIDKRRKDGKEGEREKRNHLSQGIFYNVCCFLKDRYEL